MLLTHGLWMHIFSSDYILNGYFFFAIYIFSNSN